MSDYEGKIEDCKKFEWLYHDIMTELEGMEKHSMSFGTDQIMTRSEIHLVAAIQDNPGSHVTKLAEKLEVTKGAISQLLVKLQKKGLIEKKEAPDNKSKIIISLTKKGVIAYKEHEKFHEKLAMLYGGLFKGYGKKEMMFLLEFAERSREVLRGFNEDFFEYKE